MKDFIRRISKQKNLKDKKQAVVLNKVANEYLEAKPIVENTGETKGIVKEK